MPEHWFDVCAVHNVKKVDSNEESVSIKKNHMHPVLFQVAQMSQKDQRIKLMNEVLNGIKVRKCNDIIAFIC